MFAIVIVSRVIVLYVCARAWLCEYAVCLCPCGHVSMSFSVQRLVFVLCVSSVGQLWLSPSSALRTLISPLNHLQLLSSFAPTEKLFWHAGTLLHYMTNSMWTPARRTSHSKIMGINMELVPLCCYNSLHFSGRLSTRCWNIAAGTCFHSATSVTEVGHWCCAIRPDSQSVVQFIPKVFDGVEVRALCRPVKFFHTELSWKHIII